MVSIQKSFLLRLLQRLVLVAIMSGTTTARQRKAHVLLLVVVHFSLFSLSFSLSLSLSPRVVVSRGKAFKRITKEKKKAIADLNWNDVESVLKGVKDSKNTGFQTPTEQKKNIFFLVCVSSLAY